MRKPNNRNRVGGYFVVMAMIVLFSASAVFAQETFLTPTQFENLLSTLSCQPYTLSSISDSTELHKSDVVQEITKIITTKKITLPADWRTVRFNDLNGNENYFSSAQILASLQVIPFEKFGNQTSVDPQMTREQTQEILKNVFDQSKCDFALNLDWDNDGIYNYNDTCASIPAKNTSNGCPVFSFRPYYKIQTPRIKITAPLETGTGAYTFYEQTQIQLGDRIRVVILNPKTQEILSKSEWMEVVH